MFSSSIFDVAIGVIFSFLVVSLVASTVLEAISSALKWRATDLRQGVQQLVGDPKFTGLALQLYQHAAINPRGIATTSKKDVNAPAYIPSQQFATALMDVLGLSGAVLGANATQASPIAALQAAVNTGLQGNARIQTLLTGIVQRSQGDLKQIELALGTWFDSGMDRLSGAYKRKTQLVSFLVALVLCVFLNVDAIHIARVLWEQPNIADSLKLAPNDAAALARAGGLDAPTTNSPAGESPKSSGTADSTAVPDDAAAQRAIAELDRHLPVGWTADTLAHLRDMKALEWLLLVIGWLITAAAALFGAPFWFDTLQSVVRLKGTGPSPQEKKEGRAAAA